jgi:Flp pilus assembly protein TadG
MRQRLSSARGTALIETAMVLPILLLISVAIFEFGRAYQTWEVLTNAAREGARVAVLPSATTSGTQARVMQYIQNGQLSTQGVNVSVNTNVPVSLGAAGTASGSQVTVQYPFSFIVLQPVARLVTSGTLLGAPFTMTATATMRNESQF